MEIPDDVLARVNTALNIALSLALLYAKDQHPKIMEAATALDDACGSDLGDRSA